MSKYKNLLFYHYCQVIQPYKNSILKNYLYITPTHGRIPMELHHHIRFACMHVLQILYTIFSLYCASIFGNVNPNMQRLCLLQYQILIQVKKRKQLLPSFTSPISKIFPNPFPKHELNQKVLLFKYYISMYLIRLKQVFICMNKHSTLFLFNFFKSKSQGHIVHKKLSHILIYMSHT